LCTGTIDQGARNAVETCMGLRSGERVLIISDRAEIDVGNSLRKAAEKITGQANVKLLILEDLAARPLADLPQQISDAVPNSNVTFWAAQSLPGELVSRKKLRELAIEYGRLGHMPNVKRQLMEQGMCSDYNRVYDLTHKICDRVRNAKKITVSNRLGAKIDAEFDSTWRWIPSDGRYQTKGKWGNLPEGETFTAPKSVSGKLVTNLLGDWFSKKYGNFSDPLSFEVKNSLIIMDSIKCGNHRLREDLIQYLETDQNSTKASEFALPTNPELMSMPTVGNLLQDEKARVHIAFGDPYRDETGAPWDAPTHVDMLLEQCDVVVDDLPIMKNGAYIL
jgi:aminopeptidase